jgi:DNA-directed RNA polymerase subunit RPC12/RpoP
LIIAIFFGAAMQPIAVSSPYLRSGFSSVELRTPQFQFHFVSVCNRSGSIRNAMAEKISAGSVCPDCGKGTMEPEKGVPIRGRPGFSQVVYRCTECGKVLRQAEDDRFRS